MYIYDEEFKANLARWVDSELSPNLNSWLVNGHVPFRELIRSLANAGLLHQGWEAPFGCGDIRKQLYLHYFVAQQPVGGIGLCLASHLDISARFLYKKGSDHLSELWIPRALKGEVILALAMTEPNSGSDLQGIEFSANKTEGGWCLNGTKRGITNLPFADAAIVLARTRPERSPFSYSLFLLPLNTPGVTREAALPSLGYEECLGGLVADNVILLEENLIGPVGTGLINLMQHLEVERLFVSSRMLGMAEYMFNQIKIEVKRRKPVDRHIEFFVAEHYVRLLAFQAYFELCVDNYCNGTFPTKDSAALKFMGSQLLKSLANTYILYSSEGGYMVGHPAERCYREVFGLSLAGGSEEIMLSLIGREL